MLDGEKLQREDLLEELQKINPDITMNFINSVFSGDDDSFSLYLIKSIISLQTHEYFKVSIPIPEQLLLGGADLIKKIQIKLGEDFPKINSFEMLNSPHGENFYRFRINNIQFDTSEHFSNSDRKRRYGLKIGDIVTYSYFKDKDKYEVCSFLSSDNNSCYLKSCKTGKIIESSFVAEWCDIVEKVEDRISKFDEDFQKYISSGDIETINEFTKLKIIHKYII